MKKKLHGLFHGKVYQAVGWVLQKIGIF